MLRFASAAAAFEHAVSRARQMVTLYDALSALRPAEPANDDALRAAYFQVVSSFDFFTHELAAIEVRHRFKHGLRTRKIALPMEVMAIADLDTRIDAAEARIRMAHSYKAFVDPKKLAELLSCFCDRPWDRIAEGVNAARSTNPSRTPEALKGQLKRVWKRRNQIAHEADVNPTLAGISLWPIDKADAELTITFIEAIGAQLPTVFSEPLTGPEEAPEPEEPTP